MTTNNALILAEKIDDLPKYLETVAVAAAKFCGGRDADDGMAIALVCAQQGMTFLDYNRTYHTIAGKPSMRADAMLAEFRAKYGGSYKILECSPERAAISTTDADGVTIEWEMTKKKALESRWPWRDPKDHKKGLKDNWSSDEDMENQLWARVVSKALRRVQPELVAGTYTPEEMIDVEDAPVSSTPSKDELAARIAAKRSKEAGEIIDAEFAVKDDGLPETPPLTDESLGEDPSRCTQSQRDKINELRQQFEGMTDKQWANVLAEYKVEAVNSLSNQQAQEMIDRMESRLGK